MTPKEQIALLKKEIQSLHGSLGVQGKALRRESMYSNLERRLSDAYQEIEALEEERVNFRDKLASRSMQGLLANPEIITATDIAIFNKSPEGFKLLAKISYITADALIEQKNTSQ